MNKNNQRSKPVVNFLRKEGGLRTRGMSRKQMTSERPLVTVITVVFNGKEHIEQTIQSVLDQSYKNIEYIIIDGGSADGTLDIIGKYDDRITYWISEPDCGISDAFNKGIAASEGQIIGLVNSDDWMSLDQVEQGVNALWASSADFVFGDLQMHDSHGDLKHVLRGDPLYTKRIASKMPELNHPTVLVKRSVYEKIGVFNTEFRYAMDYEWMLRLHKSGGAGLYAAAVVGHMREMGVSHRMFIGSLREVRRIAVRYGQSAVTAYYLYLYRVIKGFTRRALERWLPSSLYDKIRRIVNPRYSSGF
jgi:glycosyltransferase involved in cell wall biosynthesis